MVRNLCRATVGELLWLRGVLPPDDFDETAFGGVTTHLPKTGTQVASWLEEGVFEALEGGFLRAIVLSLWQLPEGAGEDSAEASELLESYIVRVTYSDEDQVELSVEARSGEKYTRSSASRQAISLVRTLISLVNTMPQLPEADLLVSMRLYYFDDKVPHGDDWAPKHFSDARDIMPERFADESPVKMLAGSTETQFHKLAVSVAFKREYVEARGRTAAETPSAAAAGSPSVAAATAVAAASASSAAGRGAAADPDAERQAKFDGWVETVRTHVLKTRSASLPALRQAFQDVIPPVMLGRVLAKLAARNVLRCTGKRGGVPQYRVLAVDVAEASPAPAARASSSSAAAEAGADSGLARKLFSLAVLVAWSRRGEHLTQAALGDKVGLGRKQRDVLRALMRKLVSKDLLSKTTRGNMGREVHDSNKLRAAATEASQWLAAQGMQAEAARMGLELVGPRGDDEDSDAEDTPAGSPAGVAERPTPRTATKARKRAAEDSEDSDFGSDSDASEPEARPKRSRRARGSSVLRSAQRHAERRALDG